jgi:hypothetical protein
MATIGWRLPLVGILCLGPVAGCGPVEKRRALSGSVLVMGQPLQTGTITFFAKDGPPGPVGGALIQRGRYDIPAAQGLEPGLYRVTISAPVPGGARTPAEIEAGASARAKETIADKYSAVTATTLTAEVKTDGPNRFDFNLE